MAFNQMPDPRPAIICITILSWHFKFTEFYLDSVKVPSILCGNRTLNNKLYSSKLVPRPIKEILKFYQHIDTLFNSIILPI